MLILKMSNPPIICWRSTTAQKLMHNSLFTVQPPEYDIQRLATYHFSHENISGFLIFPYCADTDLSQYPAAYLLQITNSYGLRLGGWKGCTENHMEITRKH